MHRRHHEYHQESSSINPRRKHSHCGGVSWEPEEIEEKFVDFNYPKDSGIEEELKNVGYKLAWSAEKKLSRRIYLEGWKKVVWQDQAGKQFILKSSDGLTLLMKQQNSALG